MVEMPNPENIVLLRANPYESNLTEIFCNLASTEPYAQLAIRQNIATVKSTLEMQGMSFNSYTDDEKRILEVNKTFDAGSSYPGPKGERTLWLKTDIRNDDEQVWTTTHTLLVIDPEHIPT